MNFSLGYDMEEQILLKLPAKSLLEFRSVCKSWNSLITDPKFVNKHLQANIDRVNRAFSSNESSSMVAAFVHEGDSSSDSDSDSDLDSDKEIDLGQKQRLALITETTVEYMHLPLRQKAFRKHSINSPSPLRIFHCNGIVCLVDISFRFYTRVVFLNPALGEHELIETSSAEDHFTVETFGFGHDPKTNDYKFISILQDDGFDGPAKAEVYSLRTGKWRTIELGLNFHVFPSGGVYWKGRCYWLSISKWNILSFDMSDESFGRVELPPREVKAFGSHSRVMAWGESLAYVETYRTYSPPLYYDVWVMDRRGDSWAHCFRIGPLEQHSVPLAFWKGEEMLMEDLEGCVSSYNLRSKEMTPVSLPIKPYTIKAALYVETLVSVKLRP